MIPKLIVLATSKGGVGRSTWVRSLGAHWFSINATPPVDPYKCF